MRRTRSSLPKPPGSGMVLRRLDGVGRRPNPTRSVLVGLSPVSDEAVARHAARGGPVPLPDLWGSGSWSCSLGSRPRYSFPSFVTSHSPGGVEPHDVSNSTIRMERTGRTAFSVLRMRPSAWCSWEGRIGITDGSLAIASPSPVRPRCSVDHVSQYGEGRFRRADVDRRFTCTPRTRSHGARSGCIRLAGDSVVERRQTGRQFALRNSGGR